MCYVAEYFYVHNVCEVCATSGVSLHENISADGQLQDFPVQVCAPMLKGALEPIG